MMEMSIEGYNIKVSHRIFVKREETGEELNIRIHHLARRKNRPPILLEYKDEIGKFFFYTTKEVRGFVKRNFGIMLPEMVFEEMDAKLLMKVMKCV